MAPFNTLYGRRCSFLVGLFEVGGSSLLDLDIIFDDLEKVQILRDM